MTSPFFQVTPFAQKRSYGQAADHDKDFFHLNGHRSAYGQREEAYGLEINASYTFGHPLLQQQTNHSTTHYGSRIYKGSNHLVSQ